MVSDGRVTTRRLTRTQQVEHNRQLLLDADSLEGVWRKLNAQ